MSSRSDDKSSLADRFSNFAMAVHQNRDSISQQIDDTVKTISKLLALFEKLGDDTRRWGGEIDDDSSGEWDDDGG